jgi:hypothetical protein
MRNFPEFLARFRDGLISLKELEQNIKGNLFVMEISGVIHVRQSPALRNLCVVNTHHIYEILKKYTEGKVSKERLYIWANVLVLSDAFKIVPNGSEEEKDAVLEILHEIANPEIRGEITMEKVLNYLAILANFLSKSS